MRPSGWTLSTHEHVPSTGRVQTQVLPLLAPWPQPSEASVCSSVCVWSPRGLANVSLSSILSLSCPLIHPVWNHRDESSEDDPAGSSPPTEQSFHPKAYFLSVPSKDETVFCLSQTVTSTAFSKSALAINIMCVTASKSPFIGRVP